MIRRFQAIQEGGSLIVILASGNFHVKFGVWERGDVGMTQLMDKLRDAVKHAICDVITEFQFLATPVLLPSREQCATDVEEAVAAQQRGEEEESRVEPTTPKTKRTFSFVSDFFRQTSTSSARDAKVRKPLNTLEFLIHFELLFAG